MTPRPGPAGGTIPESRHAYFMGKDNIVFHAFLWPAMLAGLRRPCATGPTASVPLHRPDDVVASEFLTMEGRSSSSSRRVVIYVRDVLERYGPDPLRFSLTAGAPSPATPTSPGPSSCGATTTSWSPPGATWSSGCAPCCAARAAWCPSHALPEGGEELLARVAGGFASVGDQIERYQFKAALHEVMALAAEVNAFVSQHEPWKVVKADPEAALGILSVAYAVCDLNVMFTPFLPHGAQRVWDNLGVDVTVPLPVGPRSGRATSATGSSAPSGTGTWASVRVDPGTPLGEASPVVRQDRRRGGRAGAGRLA